jgi:hypothetical protein
MSTLKNRRRRKTEKVDRSTQANFSKLSCPWIIESAGIEDDFRQKQLLAQQESGKSL